MVAKKAKKLIVITPNSVLRDMNSALRKAKVKFNGMNVELAIRDASQVNPHLWSRVEVYEDTLDIDSLSESLTVLAKEIEEALDGVILISDKKIRLEQDYDSTSIYIDMDFALHSGVWREKLQVAHAAEVAFQKEQAAERRRKTREKNLAKLQLKEEEERDLLAKLKEKYEQ